MNNLQPVSEVRTQIYLPKSWHQQLKKKAMRHGVSLAAYIREKIRDDVEEPRTKDREKAWKELIKMAGFIKGGPKDMSTRHSQYWADAIWKDIQRNRRGK